MLTRKKFIQQSAVLAAVLMTDKPGLYKMHKDLGLQLYTVRDEIAKAKSLAELDAILAKLSANRVVRILQPEIFWSHRKRNVRPANEESSQNTQRTLWVIGHAFCTRIQLGQLEIPVGRCQNPRT